MSDIRIGRDGTVSAQQPRTVVKLEWTEIGKVVSAEAGGMTRWFHNATPHETQGPRGWGFKSARQAGQDLARHLAGGTGTDGGGLEGGD